MKCNWLFIFIIGSLLPTLSSAQSPLLPRDPTIKGPQTFAIIMGVSKYKYVRPLTYADKDAQLFREYLKSAGGGMVKDQNIFLLLNDKASNSNFWGKGFQWLKAKNLQKGDRLFIYLAGHGDAIDEDQFFFLSYDCNPEGDKNNYLVAGAIQLFNLKKKIANETTKGVEVIFIMDACRSNELPGGVQGQNFLNSAVSEKKAGEIIMLATGAGQESLEDASIGTGQGLFTYFLVDGLNGMADSINGTDRKVTFREIQEYVNKNVPSIAKQRFKRSQDPYFCCSENSDRVISNVDTAYLQKWLKAKKAQRSGGVNAFDGIIKTDRNEVADTLLMETYNAFYKAVNSKKITGNASAEEYYKQLSKKYPGNPYTMDAKSTLAVEYIDAAQAKIDRYIRCGDEGSPREKQENYQAAINLEKAIASVREDDEDFARSLYNRLYFLRASGDYGPNGINGDISVAFKNAYAAMSIDKNGAYIQNKLAQLHLSNNNKDSALFYANKAVNTAPNWRCALLTLALVKQAIPDNNTQPKKNTAGKTISKPSVGFVLGGGINLTDPVYSGNINSGFIGTDTRSAPVFGAGILYNINLTGMVSIRPSISFNVDNSTVEFQRRAPTGGPVTIETLSLNGSSAQFSLPFIIHFTRNNFAPYITGSGSFHYLLSQNSASVDLVPLKKSFLMAGGGVGADITILKRGIISPEIKYNAGLTDLKDNGSGSGYSSALSSLKKNSFTLTVSFRKK